MCHLKLSGTIKAQLIIIKHFNDTYLGGSRSASETTVPTAAACIQGKSPRKLAESSSDLLCSMKHPRAAAGLPQGRLLCLQPPSELPGLWLLIRITDPDPTQWALVSLLCGSAGDGAGGLLHFSVPLSPLYKYPCKLPSMFPIPGSMPNSSACDTLAWYHRWPSGLPGHWGSWCMTLRCCH